MEAYVYFASAAVILFCAVYMALDPLYPDKIIRHLGLGVLIVAQLVIISDGLFGHHQYVVLPCTVATEFGVAIFMACHLLAFVKWRGRRTASVP